jgi:heme exporter protein A
MTSEPAQPPLLLRARELACERGGRVVCRDQNLALAAGNSIWLRGRNGCGKTSLLRVLAGLARPAHGDLWQAPRVSSLFIGHQNALKDELTVAENQRFLARLCRLERNDAALDQALKAWGLWSRRHLPARALSQGLRRRLSLSRLSLAEGARLWLLDEPFDALDDEGVATLGAALYGHRALGGACVLSSHLPLGFDRLPQLEHWVEQRGAAA